MKPICTFRHVVMIVLLAVSSLTLRVSANPVTVAYTDVASQCFDPPNANLTEEVGPDPPFPVGEQVSVSVMAATVGDCSIAVGGGNDYTVTITNLSGHALCDVFIAADTGITFDNWDGTIAGNRAKKIADSIPSKGSVSVHLMNVAPNAPPTFASLGVPSGGAGSTFSIVANFDTCIPTVSDWGLAAMALLVLSAATVVIMRRRAAVG